MFYRKSKKLSHNLYLLSQLSVKLANSLKLGYFYSPVVVKLHGDLDVEAAFFMFLSWLLAEGLENNSNCWLNGEVN